MVRTVDRSYPDFQGEAETAVQKIEQKQSETRAHLMALEEVKMLREDVAHCYLTEGVNHLQNCREKRIAYVERIQSKKFPFPVRHPTCLTAIIHVGLSLPFYLTQMHQADSE